MASLVKLTLAKFSHVQIKKFGAGVAFLVLLPYAPIQDKTESLWPSPLLWPFKSRGERSKDLFHTQPLIIFKYPSKFDITIDSLLQHYYHNLFYSILNMTKTHDKKVALITGITGQDGSYLTEFLLEKGYTVSFFLVIIYTYMCVCICILFLGWARQWRGLQ